MCMNVWELINSLWPFQASPLVRVDVQGITYDVLCVRVDLKEKCIILETDNTGAEHDDQ